MKNLALAVLFFFSWFLGGSIGNLNRTEESSLSSNKPGSSYGEVSSDFSQNAEELLAFLPLNDRKAWMQYLLRVGNIHSGANESIELANSRLMEGPCFSDLAAAFYTWLMEEDFKDHPFVPASRDRPLGSRPSLADVAKEPGGIWRKALQVSGGSANLALALIGLCGHDDAIAFKPELIPDRSATERFVQSKRKVIQQAREYLLNRARIAESASLRSWYEEMAEDVVELNNPEKQRDIFCLNSSVVMQPQSLGADVDITDELKSEISRFQSPTLGARAIPAKYYHFIGSAMNACLLRSQTWTSVFSPALNKMAAGIYRARSLKSKIGRQLPQELKNFDFESLSVESIKPVVDEYNLIYPDERSVERRMLGPSAAEREFERNPSHAVARLFTVPKVGAKLTPSKALADVHRAVAEVDAGELVSKFWRLSRFPLVGELFMPPSKNAIPTDCDKSGWPAARCRRALDVLRTWEVDYRWTREQHFAGAYFGMRQCRALAPGVTLETLACSALQKQAIQDDRAAIAR